MYSLFFIITLVVCTHTHCAEQLPPAKILTKKERRAICAQLLEKGEFRKIEKFLEMSSGVYYAVPKDVQNTICATEVSEWILPYRWYRQWVIQSEAERVVSRQERNWKLRKDDDNRQLEQRLSPILSSKMKRYRITTALLVHMPDPLTGLVIDYYQPTR